MSALFPTLVYTCSLLFGLVVPIPTLPVCVILNHSLKVAFPPFLVEKASSPPAPPATLIPCIRAAGIVAKSVAARLKSIPIELPVVVSLISRLIPSAYPPAFVERIVSGAYGLVVPIPTLPLFFTINLSPSLESSEESNKRSSEPPLALISRRPSGVLSPIPNLPADVSVILSVPEVLPAVAEDLNKRLPPLFMSAYASPAVAVEKKSLPL